MLFDDLLDPHHLDDTVDGRDAGVGGTPSLPGAMATGAGAPLRDAAASLRV
ncbi:hypothetical protein [Serinicoccus sp. LYQ131]|uniref:hypothetical protein n=1 Tax=Serinicoccus sp. LYQ131 TaxID=3378797 RepID=UPI0038528DDE